MANHKREKIKDSFADLLIDAYAAGVKAASTDVKWDGRKSAGPLSGATASGMTVYRLLEEEFRNQIDAATAQYVAENSGKNFDEERRAADAAVIDAWENGYDSYEPWPE